MTTKIIFNGKEYASVDEMPAQARQAYEQMMGMFVDRNRNGVPDAFDEAVAAHTAQAGVSMSAINFNGQTYASLDEMPPEARQAFERAMSALNVLGDRNQNGIPDIVESALPPAAGPVPAAPPAQRAERAPIAPTAAPVVSGNVEQGEHSLRLLLVGIGLFVAMGLIALLVAVLVFNQYVGPR
jgi:hypothetical protein